MPALRNASPLAICHAMRRLVGLVGRVVPLADLEATAYALAEEMASLAPLTPRWHKRIIQTVLRDPGLRHLSPEEEALPYACFDTADFHEGFRAFLAKRRPLFTGEEGRLGGPRLWRWRGGP